MGPHAQRLALGARRERVGRHPRHQGVRAARCSTAATRATSSTPRRATAASPRCRARRSTPPPRRRSSRHRVALRAAARRSGSRSAPRCCSRARTCCAPACSSRGATGPTEWANDTPAADAVHDRSSRSRSPLPAAGIEPRLHAGRGGRRGRSSTRIRDGPVLDPARRASAPTSTIRARAESMLTRTNPDLHLRPGSLTDDAATATSSSRPTATPGCRTREYREWLDPEYRERFDDVPRRAGPGCWSWPSAGLPQRGVRRGVAARRTRRACAAAGTRPGATRSSTPTAWSAR